MAICLLNQDALKTTQCGYSLAEIVRIYLANFDEVSATTLSTGASGQSVATITMEEGKKFYKIDPARNSATWTDELVVTDAGSKYRTHTINFNIGANLTPDMADIIDALSLGKYVAVIQKSDGSYAMLGRLTGVEASVVTMGGSSDDSVFNGAQVTLTANTNEVALPLEATAIATVTGQ